MTLTAQQEQTRYNLNMLEEITRCVITAHGAKTDEEQFKACDLGQQICHILLFDEEYLSFSAPYRGNIILSLNYFVDRAGEIFDRNPSVCPSWQANKNLSEDELLF